jgi:translation initiation factor IF-1
MMKGWHDDPYERFQARWHNGKKWTKHISHFGAVGKDPIWLHKGDHIPVLKWSIILTTLLLLGRYFL